MTLSERKGAANSCWSRRSCKREHAILRHILEFSSPMRAARSLAVNGWAWSASRGFVDHCIVSLLPNAVVSSQKGALESRPRDSRRKGHLLGCRDTHESLATSGSNGGCCVQCIWTPHIWTPHMRS